MFRFYDNQNIRACDDIIQSVQSLFEWNIVGWIVAFLIPIAFGFVSFKEYVSAKVCFVVPVLFLAGRIVMWDKLLNLPLIWRFAACLLLFGILGFAAVESFRWVDRKKVQNEGKTVTEVEKKVIDEPSSTPQKRLRILVCSFDGPDASTYRVAELISDGLRKMASEYEDVEVILGPLVSSEEGSSIARKVGKEKNCALVLWGFYTKTKDKELVTTYFEVLNSIPYMPVTQGSEVLSMEVGNLDSFKMQFNLSEDLRYFASVALGLTYYGEDKYDLAIKLLTDAVNTARTSSAEQILDSAVPYFYRGNIYHVVGQHELAVQDFNTSNNLSPNPRSLLNRSRSYFSLGKLENARADLQKAIEMDASYKEAYVNLGIIEFVSGNPQKAVELYNKSLLLDGNQPVAYFNRSVVNMVTGKIEDALKDLTKAVQLDPKYSQAFQNRGALFLQKERLEDAMADFNKAIELEPENATFYFNRAAANLQNKNIDSALDDLNKGLSLDPTNAKAHYNRGVIYYQREKQEELAIAELTEAVRLSPDYGDPYCFRGMIYFLKRENLEHDKALSDFNKCLDIYPQSIMVRQNRVVIFINRKQWKKAIPDLEYIIKNSDNNEFREQSQILLKQVKEEHDKLQKQKKKR